MASHGPKIVGKEPSESGMLCSLAPHRVRDGKTATFVIYMRVIFSIFTTIDPETYEKDKEGEPLKSLKTFRLASGKDRKFIDVYKNSPLVGMNTVLLKTGKISVGDEVILTSY